MVWGVMKYPMPTCHCLSINYEIFILKWPFSASSQKSSQWFSSMTLYAKWPHKLVDFNNMEPCLPLLAPTVQFRKFDLKSSLICVKIHRITRKRKAGKNIRATDLKDKRPSLYRLSYRLIWSVLYMYSRCDCKNKLKAMRP